MKPESSSQDSAIEQLAPQERRSVEARPVFDNPEEAIIEEGEAYERKSEADAIRADIGLSTVLPSPVIGTTKNDTGDSTNLSNNPVVANDDDLIEREWVDKAKRIVAETRNDPHLQDKEVNKLQADYLKKRFGRELGAAE
jgi:hypothetical protein